MKKRSCLVLAAILAVVTNEGCGREAPAAAAPPAEAQTTPESQPEEPRGLRLNTEEAFDGLTLVAPLNSHDIHLVDLDGEVVHTWKLALAPGGGTYFLENGHLLRLARKEGNPRFHGGGIGGLIQEFDWDGALVWEYELATAERTSHHDLQKLSNGNLLSIAWEYHSPDEAIARGRDAEAVPEEGLWPDVVLEIRPTPPAGGEIVWEWRAWDHLVQDRDSAKEGYGLPSDHPGRIDINADHRYRPKEISPEELKKREELEKQMRAVGYAGGDDPKDAKPADPADHAFKPEGDWLHTNAVTYHAELDLIVLSTPHMCELWVIDHSTTTAEAAGSTGGRFGHGGDLLYRYGNPRNFGRGGEGDQRLFYQHHPSWLPGDAELRLLVFNNGGERPDGDYSSVEELALPFDPARGFLREESAAFGPAEPAWSYSDAASFFSPFISGAQRLPNGNTLICAGKDGRVFEVTADKRVVWDFWSPLGGEIEPSPQGGKAPPKALFRATRIARDHPGLKGRM